MDEMLSADDEITIVDRKGRVVVNRLPEKFKPKETGEKAANVANSMIRGINNSLSEYNFVGLETIMLQGTKGKLCILPAPDSDDFYITLVGKIG